MAFHAVLTPPVRLSVLRALLALVLCFSWAEREVCQLVFVPGTPSTQDIVNIVAKHDC